MSKGTKHPSMFVLIHPLSVRHYSNVMLISFFINCQADKHKQTSLSKIYLYVASVHIDISNTEHFWTL